MKREVLPQGFSRRALVASGLCALACGSGLRQIPRGEHPLTGGAQPIAVDSAPPPAQIDVVGPAPSSECAWADGQWLWEDNQWSWQRGRWVRVPAGCYYADSLIVWVPAVGRRGVLFYTHGQWYGARGGVCSAPLPCASTEDSAAATQR